MKCDQVDCNDEATERFVWPGSGWSSACATHALRAVSIAEAMGFTLVVEPLPASETEPEP